MHGIDKRDLKELFSDRYSERGSDVARQVEIDAFGHDVGLNGYTTLEQANDLSRHLGMGAGDRLLDLGAGRGWPGLHIATQLGCRLISTDLPWEALTAAKGRGAGWVLGADGCALPLGSGTCDAVVHADVFC